MKQKFIDVRTSINGEINDTLCFNNATAQQLNAVLTLASEGYEVLVIVHEKEVKEVPMYPDFDKDEK